MMNSKPSTVLASLLLLSVASAVVYPEVGEQFDHVVPLSGTEDCALLSVVVDESGSMRNEHKFMQDKAIPGLVTELKANNFNHIFVCSHGFGSQRSAATGFQFHGCTDAMTWQEPPSATVGDLDILSSWMTLGGTEDAYLGTIMAVRNTPATISGFQLNTTCRTMAKNMILLTDEDRDEFLNQEFTKADVAYELGVSGFVFNAIVNLDITGEGNSWRALGFEEDFAGTTKTYIPNVSGSGTYTTPIQPNNYMTYLNAGAEAGNSDHDYPSLALNSGGAVWDLGMLRLQNSDYTDAFVASFIDKKVQEIVIAQPPVSSFTPTVTNANGGGGNDNNFEYGPGHVEVDPAAGPPGDYDGGGNDNNFEYGPGHVEVDPAAGPPGDNNFQIPTDYPGDYFQDATDYPGDYFQDATDGPVSDGGGSVKGDPHFKTWKNEHYEYHGQCDMVFVNDPDFANGLGLDIQIRSKLVRFWSYIQSVAIRIGNDILELQGSADPEDYEFRYWINYEFQGEVDTIGGFPVKKYNKKVHSHKNKFEIDLSSVFDNAPKIVISSFKEFLKIEFENASEQVFGNSVGMLGHFQTGKTLARDGATVVDDFTEFGHEWQVLPSDGRLFHDSTSPQFPEHCIEPEDPRGERRRRLDEGISGEEAEAACASLKDPLDRKDCVYDILATQDMEMVGAY